MPSCEAVRRCDLLIKDLKKEVLAKCERIVSHAALSEEERDARDYRVAKALVVIALRNVADARSWADQVAEAKKLERRFSRF